MFKKISSEILYRKGVKQAENGLYQNAISIFEQVLTKNKNHSGAHFSIAVSFQELQIWDGAISHYNIVKKLKPYTYDLEMYLAICHCGNGELETALIHINNQLEITPNNPNVYGNRSHIYFRMEEFEKSLLDADTAIELGPENSYSYSFKADILNTLERFEESIGYYNKAIELDDNNLVAKSNKINPLEHLKKFKEALELVKELIITCAPSDMLYLKSGKINLELGNRKIAFEHLHKSKDMGNSEAKEVIKKNEK
jgi:tetratricopeptide (TPR) repeat protein